MADRVLQHGQRQQEVKSGEYANEVYTVNAVSAAVAQQRFFIASSGKLSLTVAGNVRSLITNPAGSGRNVFISRLAVMATGTGYASLYINPTTGLPATAARPPLNATIGGTAPVATVKIDLSATTPLGGGLDAGVVFGLPVNTRQVIDLPPLILTPGVSLGINDPFTGAADATIAVYWFEEDI